MFESPSKPQAQERMMSTALYVVLTQLVPQEALECRTDSVDAERLSSYDVPHEHHP